MISRILQEIAGIAPNSQVELRQMISRKDTLRNFAPLREFFF